MKQSVYIVVKSEGQEAFMISLEDAKVELSYDVGHALVANEGFETEMVPNGEIRISLKAWKGCENFAKAETDDVQDAGQG